MPPLSERMHDMKRITAILLALLMFLGSLCAVGEEELEALRAENARLRNRLNAYEDMSVIAVFDVGCVTFDEVQAAYREYSDMYAILYEAFGIDYALSAEEELALQMEITRQIAEDRLIDYYLDHRGLTLLSAEDEALLRARAKEEYEMIYAENCRYYEEEGYSEQEIKALVDAYMQEEGLTEDDLFQAAADEARHEALYALLSGGAEVTREDVEAMYAEMLASDERYYGEDPAQYAYDALYGETPAVFVPEGYRRVKLLIIPFSEDDMIAYDELLAEGKEDGEEADALFSRLEPVADDILRRIGAGESFETLQQAADPQRLVPQELTDPRGISVSMDFDLLGDTFAQAAIALAVPGEISGPVRSLWGLVVIEYEGEIPSGAIPLEEVYEAMSTLALESKREEAYAAALAGIEEEAGLVFFFDRLG